MKLLTTMTVIMFAAVVFHVAVIPWYIVFLPEMVGFTMDFIVGYLAATTAKCATRKLIQEEFAKYAKSH